MCEHFEKAETGYRTSNIHPFHAGQFAAIGDGMCPICNEGLIVTNYPGLGLVEHSWVTDAGLKDGWFGRCPNNHGSFKLVAELGVFFIWPECEAGLTDPRAIEVPI